MMHKKRAQIWAAAMNEALAADPTTVDPVVAKSLAELRQKQKEMRPRLRLLKLVHDDKDGDL